MWGRQVQALAPLSPWLGSPEPLAGLPGQGVGAARPLSGLSEVKDERAGLLAFLAKEGCDSSHPSEGVVDHGLIPRGKLSCRKHTQRGKGRGSGHQPSRAGQTALSQPWLGQGQAPCVGCPKTPGWQTCDLEDVFLPPGLPSTPRPPILPTCGSKGPGGHPHIAQGRLHA